MNTPNIAEESAKEYLRIYVPKRGDANECCFICKKNAGGCAWSREFKPIPGWQATKREQSTFHELGGFSYKIHYCPEFEEGDSAKGQNYDTERCMDLLEAVYRAAAYDYKKAFEEKRALSKKKPGLHRSEIFRLNIEMSECANFLGPYAPRLHEELTRAAAEADAKEAKNGKAV